MNIISICLRKDKIYHISTPQGIVWLTGPVTSHCLKKLDFGKDLRNFRPASRQKEALIQIAGQPKGMVYIAFFRYKVIGYICFHNPNKHTRWSKHPRILEVGTIEIAPKWRKYKIASKLLELAFSNPIIEEYIVITIEFYWHWDLEQTKMNVWQYQKMLTKLFGSVGMHKVPTDDPCVLEHLANTLMVRYGKKVSRADLRLFSELQFERKGIISAKSFIF